MIYSAFLHENRSQSRKNAVFCLLCEYVFLVLCVTIVCRPSTLEHSYRIIPFTTYIELFITEKSYLPLVILKEISMNTLLFFPVGLLLGCIKITWRRVICVAIGLALAIEILQFVTCKGCCESNDVIHNTIGALLVFFMIRWLINIIRIIRNKYYAQT